MSPAAPAQDFGAALAACPGGREWMQAEQARQRALGPPPAIVPTEPALREELLKMQADDQQSRHFALSGKSPSTHDLSAAKQVDARHLPRLRAIVDQHGFPHAAQVGRDGVAAAWLLVQHADADPRLQERVLRAVAGRDESDGISRQKVALLSDGVRIGQGRPQLYGTKFARDAAPGDPPSEPIEDPARLDERRAAMHMMPIAVDRCVRKAMSFRGVP